MSTSQNVSELETRLPTPIVSLVFSFTDIRTCLEVLPLVSRTFDRIARLAPSFPSTTNLDDYERPLAYTLHRLLQRHVRPQSLHLNVELRDSVSHRSTAVTDRMALIAFLDHCGSDLTSLSSTDNEAFITGPVLRALVHSKAPLTGLDIHPTRDRLTQPMATLLAQLPLQTLDLQQATVDAPAMRHLVAIPSLTALQSVGFLSTPAARALHGSEVRHLGFSPAPEWTDLDLVTELIPLRLTCLSLGSLDDRVSITDAGLAALMRQSAGLVRLGLAFGRVQTTMDYLHVLPRSLRELDLDCFGLSGTGLDWPAALQDANLLRPLAQLSLLQVIRLHYWPHQTGVGLVWLAHLPALRDLILVYWPDLEAQRLFVLLNIKQLRWLCLDTCGSGCGGRLPIGADDPIVGDLQRRRPDLRITFDEDACE